MSVCVWSTAGMYRHKGGREGVLMSVNERVCVCVCAHVQKKSKSDQTNRVEGEREEIGHHMEAKRIEQETECTKQTSITTAVEFEQTECLNKSMHYRIR